MANDFAQLIDEGRALLGEMVGKPVKAATRDTIDQVSEKVADLQDYALARCARGSGARREVWQAGGSATFAKTRGPRWRAGSRSA